MRKTITFLCFLLLASVRIVAQDKLDSVSIRLNKFNAALNSNPKTSHTGDTISPALTHYTHYLDSTKRGLSHRIDSLKKLKLPTSKYERKLDSLNRINPLKVVQQQEAKLAAAEQKVTGTVTGLERKADQELNAITKEAAGGVNVPGANLPGTNLPGVNLNANPNLNSSLSLPNNSLPQLNNPINGNTGLGDVQKDVNSVSGLPQKEMSDLKNVSEVSSAEKDMGEAGKLAQKATGYEKQISGVAKGDSASMAQLSNTAENDAKNIGGMKDLQKETGAVDNYKKLATQAEDPEALKKEATQQIQKQAVNHFAGKEQVLNGAMNRVNKLKQKYSSVKSLNDIPKRPPNEMHGKPFIERIIPGLTFVVLKVNRKTMLDFNPWIGYRFTGHLTAGAGWNERIEISHYRLSWQQVYGPRIFGEYKLKKGFSARAEVETMNTIVPPNQVPPNGDPNGRMWVWNTFAGLKREYKLFKHVKGNIQILYNVSSLFNHHNINIYGDPLTVRMGFEFPMTKKKK